MYQLNPLLEARVFHRGQMKQNSYLISQARSVKDAHQRKLKKIDFELEFLKKNLGKATDERMVKNINNRINQLLKKRENVSRLIASQDGVINTHKKIIRRMSETNRKVGASMRK